MATQAPITANTVGGTIEHWKRQLAEFFRDIGDAARGGGWHSSLELIDIRENLPGWGWPLNYEAPLLVLKRPDPLTGEEQRIRFEPRFRFTIGSAGRIDVSSYPQFREAMLLRLPEGTDLQRLTWDKAEECVSATPWKAFSPERLPLQADVREKSGLLAFLESLVGTGYGSPSAVH